MPGRALSGLLPFYSTSYPRTGVPHVGRLPPSSVPPPHATCVLPKAMLLPLLPTTVLPYHAHAPRLRCPIAVYVHAGASAAGWTTRPAPAAAPSTLRCWTTPAPCASRPSGWPATRPGTHAATGAATPDAHTSTSCSSQRRSCSPQRRSCSRRGSSSRCRGGSRSRAGGGRKPPGSLLRMQSRAVLVSGTRGRLRMRSEQLGGHGRGQVLKAAMLRVARLAGNGMRVEGWAGMARGPWRVLCGQRDATRRVRRGLGSSGGGRGLHMGLGAPCRGQVWVAPWACRALQSPAPVRSRGGCCRCLQHAWVMGGRAPWGTGGPLCRLGGWERCCARNRGP